MMDGRKEGKIGRQTKSCAGRWKRTDHLASRLTDKPSGRQTDNMFMYIPRADRQTETECSVNGQMDVYVCETEKMWRGGEEGGRGKYG